MPSPKPNPILRMKNLIEALSLPVSEKEASDGWSGKSKAAIKAWLVETLAKVSKGEPIPEVSLSRGLDFWGVHDGFLLKEITELSNELRELCNPLH